MLNNKELYQSLAACGAVLVAFIGVCHEVVGTAMFPWGPALFGGLVVWHFVGVGCFLVGVGLLLGVLGVIWFPVVAVSSVLVPIAGGIAVFTAAAHGAFHLFAFTLAAAGVVTAIFHRKGAGLRG